MENQGDDIARIRQILFGHNVSEIEKRIGLTEQQLQSQLDELGHRLTRLADALTVVQQQLDDLRSQLADTGRLIQQHEQNLSDRIASGRQHLEDELAQLRKSLSDTADNLRASQAAATDHHNAALIQLREQMTEKLRLMQTAKVDRSALALLLNELAYQLSGSSDNLPNKIEPDHE
ncbi:MAG: hypothetical protein IPM52_00560 [Bacteroidetes bacterium]|nr:hypothetical protein [Bacteroidota bacterium]